MPLDRDAEFVAVDEIQLCADPDRGHVFTDRLLHARGLVETMFLGAETIRPLLQRAGAAGRDRDPAAPVAARPMPARPSWSRLPPRSAVVAFSAGEVYAHRRADPPPARRLRRGHGPALAAHPQRPGAALPGQGGRLPGRHRRDRDGPQHGRGPRRLRRPDQVRRPPAAPADRAGGGADRRPRRARHARRHVRHHRRPARRCDDELVAGGRGASSSSRCEQLYWRNAALDFASVDALLASLQAPPPLPGLVRGPDASRPADAGGAGARAGDPRAGARHGAWCGCCGRPAASRISASSPTTRTPGSAPGCSATSPREGSAADRLARQPASPALARADGDIDTLMQRLSGVRVWSYIAARADWVRGRRRTGRRSAREVGGPAVGRAARAADRPLRRPPRRPSDAPARGAGRARSCSPP